jgi:hypothetical protein
MLKPLTEDVLNSFAGYFTADQRKEILSKYQYYDPAHAASKDMYVYSAQYVADNKLEVEIQ